MPYIGNQPGTGVRSRFIYTATASQTTFSGADDNSKTLKYADSAYVDVFLNGICLVPGTDYTASTKTSIVLTQAASLNDTLEVVAYDIASMDDSISKADGGTFEADIGISNTSPDLTFTNSTSEDTDGGRESTITFKGKQSGGEESTLAQIQASHDATADDQKGELILRVNDGNDGSSPSEVMRIDSLGNVGIGTDTIDVSTQAGGSGYKALQIESDEGGQLNFDHNDAGTGSTLGQINFQRAGEVLAEIEAVTDGATDNGKIVFRTQPDGGALQQRMQIDHDGNVGIYDQAYEANLGFPLHIIKSSDYTVRFRREGATNNPLIEWQIQEGSGGSVTQRLSGSTVNQFFMETGSTRRFEMNNTGNKLFTNGEGGTGYNLYADAGATTAFALRLDGSGTGSSNIVQFVNQYGQVGSITLSGASTAYNTSSDYRLKENLTDITDGITRVKQLSPKKFNWISDETDTLIDGFLAHEAQTVVPEAITGTKDQVHVWLEDEELPEGVSVGDNKLDDNGNTIPMHQSIDQSKLVPLLTAALKEAIAKIETLETKVAALEAG